MVLMERTGPRTPRRPSHARSPKAARRANFNGLVFFGGLTLATFAFALATGMTLPGDPAPRNQQLWLPVVICLSVAILFATGFLLDRAPPARRRLIDVAAPIAIVAIHLLIFAWPARALPSVAALTGDQWPLAVAFFVLALPAALLVPARVFPGRFFAGAALIAFVLILPDYLGAYISYTGEQRIRFTYLERVFRWLAVDEETAARARASGIFVTWYVLLLAAAWLPLAAGLWVRMRRASRFSPGRPPDRNP